MQKNLQRYSLGEVGDLLAKADRREWKHRDDEQQTEVAWRRHGKLIATGSFGGRVFNFCDVTVLGTHHRSRTTFSGEDALVLRKIGIDPNIAKSYGDPIPFDHAVSFLSASRLDCHSDSPQDTSYTWLRSDEAVATGHKSVGFETLVIIEQTRKYDKTVFRGDEADRLLKLVLKNRNRRRHYGDDPQNADRRLPRRVRQVL